MREPLQAGLQKIVAGLLTESGDTEAVPDFTVEVPRRADHGDFACNVAMLLAGRLRQSPRLIAEALKGRLGTLDGFLARVEVAGPGFLNFWLAGERWQELLRRILDEADRYGRSDQGKGQAVQVEFVSANPTGPLSLGHGRQAILGDSIARLLEWTGHAVTREYYFNNGGRQMRVLGESVRARYLEVLGLAAPPPDAALDDPEAPWPDERDGLPVVFPRDGYRGAYIRDLADTIHRNHQKGWVEESGDAGFRELAEKTIFGTILSTLDRLDIRFDEYFNEASLYEGGQIEQVLTDLRARDLVYEHEGAVWFKATALDLPRDRVLVRSNGEPTYLLPDIAYHREKFTRGFERVIDVMGADHIEQFPSVQAAVGALGCDPARIELVMHQFVTLSSGGEKVKQSTRKATFVTIDELLDEVGNDVFRFFMIQRKPEGHLDFDLESAREKDWKKNPAYYVQYAYARTHGIVRKAHEVGLAMPDPAAIDGSLLALPEEVELVRKLGEFPGLIENAANAREPHHVAYYLRELAGLWNPYLQDGTRHRVLSEDRPLTVARLGLVAAVQIVLGNGLGLLGLSTPERM